MKSKSFRLLAAGALVALSLPCHAAGWHDVAAGAPGLALALLWLVLLGWGFMALLRLYLRSDAAREKFNDALAAERQARQRAEQATGEARSALRRMADQHIAIRELERQRIGRDIHDDLGQHLLALKIDLSMMHLSTAGAHPQLHQKLGDMIHGLDQTVQSLRAIINDLRPLGLEQGLRRAIDQQLAEFSRLHGVRCRFDPGPGEPDIHPSCEAALFRILQEALANIARHARASEVQVTLALSKGQLALTVQDNGVGIDAPAHGHGCGCGLEGIRQRVASAGGQFSIDSTGGVGTRLAMSIPLQPTVAAT